jgi:Ran GTPase-activating protein (RanGAP) involved in mRNA processing and transport
MSYQYDVKAYCSTLVKYLTSSQKTLEIIRSTNQFTEEAETSLKEAIAESKKLLQN